MDRHLQQFGFDLEFRSVFWLFSAEVDHSQVYIELVNAS